MYPYSIEKFLTNYLVDGLRPSGLLVPHMHLSVANALQAPTDATAVHEK